jgi:hypothetical protein
MSEEDMPILIQTLLHYLNPTAEIPALAHVILTIREIKTRSPEW